jgi:hypothetical protein
LKEVRQLKSLKLLVAVWIAFSVAGIGQILQPPVKPITPPSLTTATFSDPNEPGITDGKDFKSLTFICHPDGTVTLKLDFYGKLQIAEFFVYFNIDDDQAAELMIRVSRAAFAVAKETSPGSYGDVVFQGIPLLTETSFSISVPWKQLFGGKYVVGVWAHSMDGGDRLPDGGELWFIPSECKVELAATPRGDGLLIVTPREFWDPLTRLWYWKRKTGIPTYIVAWESLQYGRDEAERIKYAIDFYYREHQVRYVMLVGDSEKLPVRYTLQAYEYGRFFPDDLLNRNWRWTDNQGRHEENWNWCAGGPWVNEMADFVPRFFASDLYYADLYGPTGAFQTWDTNGNGYFGEAYRSNLNPEGIDLMPDVAVGRVPASTVQEVENYVTKVINYEATAASSTQFKKALIAVNVEERSWVECGAKLKESLSAKGFTFYYYEIPQDQSADQYVNNLSSWGLGFVFYAGHGPWGLGTYGNWHTCLDVLPIVVHIGCDAGDFGPNVLTFRDAGYVDIFGRRHTSYARGEHYPCAQFPPPPSTLQPDEEEGSYAEFLTVKASNNGAIAYFAATYATQAPGPNLGRLFLEAYTPGKLLGQMWQEAVTKYYREYVAGKVAPFKAAFRGTQIWSWEPWDSYYMIQKFVLFGDPSLRVGGLPKQ